MGQIAHMHELILSYTVHIWHATNNVCCRIRMKCCKLVTPDMRVRGSILYQGSLFVVSLRQLTQHSLVGAWFCQGRVRLVTNQIEVL